MVPSNQMINQFEGGRFEMRMRYTLKLNNRLNVSWIKTDSDKLTDVEKSFWEVASVMNCTRFAGKKFINQHCQVIAERI